MTGEPPVPPADPKPAASPAAGNSPAPKKKSRPRKPTGRGKGRHNDCPWDEVERLYVQGDIVSTGTNAAERVWPSSEEVAARFRVSSPTVREHARTGGWSAKREEFRRRLHEAAAAREADFISKATELWRAESQKIWELNVAALDEAKFTYDFHKSGRAAELARSSPKGGRKPSGGDADSQEREQGPATTAAANPSQREPMSARDQKDLATAVKTAKENMLAMLVGAQAPGTVPQTTGAPAVGATPAAIDPRAAALIDDFVMFSAASNKNPGGAAPTPSAPKPSASAAPPPAPAKPPSPAVPPGPRK